MKKLLFSVASCLLGFHSFNAQCSTAISTASATNTTYAFVTGQSFKAGCSAKLNNITFPKISAFSDDLRSSGYKIGIRVKNASNQVLANGFWSNGTTQTDVWYPNATNVTADFQCADLGLVNGDTYIWEVYAIPGSQENIELILFGTAVGTTYADGAYIKDGVTSTTDALGWSVNLTTTVNGLAATETQTNPSNATATDGSASVFVSGGVSTATATYVWKKNGNVLTGQTGAALSNLGVGTYSVDITKGCTITKTFTLTANTLAVGELVQNKWSLYPNPATTEINLNFSDAEKIEIYSADGRLVKFLESKQGYRKINISALPNGNYILKSHGSSLKFIKK